jgi:hypothetical protein
MGSRQNGRDLKLEAVLEEGLTRLFKLPQDRKVRVAFIFGLIRRIYRVASLITMRDDEMAEAVLGSLDFSEAARRLSPEKPESMRARISARYADFRAICELFLAPLDGVDAESRVDRLQPKSNLRGPEGHLEPTGPEFGGKRGYIRAVRGKAKLNSRAPSVCRHD